MGGWVLVTGGRLLNPFWVLRLAVDDRSAENSGPVEDTNDVCANYGVRNGLYHGARGVLMRMWIDKDLRTGGGLCAENTTNGFTIADGVMVSTRRTGSACAAAQS